MARPDDHPDGDGSVTDDHFVAPAAGRYEFRKWLTAKPDLDTALVQPMDLLAPPTLILSTDPHSLDYWGPLNLAPFGRDGSRGNECSLHALTIGEDGCPRCREIHEHRKTMMRDA
jgi:hypothetical protein